MRGSKTGALLLAAVVFLGASCQPRRSAGNEAGTGEAQPSVGSGQAGEDLAGTGPAEPVGTGQSREPAGAEVAQQPVGTGEGEAPADIGTGEGPMLTSVTSQATRNLAPEVPESDVATAANGNNALATSLYQALRGEPGNLFFSPYSITTALAMTWAGAGGETAAQMANTLHFDLPPDGQHAALNALDLGLQAQADEAPQEGEEGDPFRLRVANALWAQTGFTFLPTFLDLLAVHYGADVKLVNFQTETEPTRLRINQWVSEQTEGKIPELIPQGAVDADTRLVLTNAVYFKASWLYPFEEANTEPGPFHRRDGSTVDVPMMKLEKELAYLDGDGFSAVDLPYFGGSLSMLVLLPDEGGLDAFEASLDAERLASVTRETRNVPVELVFPRFTFRSQLDLGEVLAALGMPAAFDAGIADFSGMTGGRDLYIGAVLHEAFVAVDEEGTEAAAATAVIMQVRGMPMEPPEPVRMVVDRPFVFAIRDRASGVVLFVGRVDDPAAE